MGRLIFKIMQLLLLLSLVSGCGRLINQLEAPLPKRTEHKKGVTLPPLKVPTELASPSVSQVD